MCPIDDEESGPAGGRERGNNARSLLLPAPVDYEPWNVETLIPRKQHSMQPDGQMMHIVDSDPNYESVINLQPSIHIPRFNCEGDCKSFSSSSSTSFSSCTEKLTAGSLSIFEEPNKLRNLTDSHRWFDGQSRYADQDAGGGGGGERTKTTVDYCEWHRAV